MDGVSGWSCLLRKFKYRAICRLTHLLSHGLSVMFICGLLLLILWIFEYSILWVVVVGCFMVKIFLTTHPCNKIVSICNLMICCCDFSFLKSSTLSPTKHVPSKCHCYFKCLHMCNTLKFITHICSLSYWKLPIKRFMLCSYAALLHNSMCLYSILYHVRQNNNKN